VGRRHLSLLALVSAAALFTLPFVSTPISGQAGRPAVVALKGGTVVTVTKGTIRNGTVLMRDGKIAAVGANVSIPSGAEVIDVTGRFVSPGIIDAHSHIAADAINEGGTTVSSMTGIEDVLDPTDVSI
jgi:imidazolonepropionase-like amidohydrolase